MNPANFQVLLRLSPESLLVGTVLAEPTNLEEPRIQQAGRASLQSSRRTDTEDAPAEAPDSRWLPSEPCLPGSGLALLEGPAQLPLGCRANKPLVKSRSLSDLNVLAPQGDVRMAPN